MTREQRDRHVSEEIRDGRCPFGVVERGQDLATCQLGFPGCHCADEFELNPFLADLRAARDADYAEFLKQQEAQEEAEATAAAARCPDGQPCKHEAEWGHPCDRDEAGRYICEKP